MRNTPPSLSSDATFAGYAACSVSPPSVRSSLKLIASYVPLSVTSSHSLALTPDGSSSFGEKMSATRKDGVVGSSSPRAAAMFRASVMDAGE